MKNYEPALSKETLKTVDNKIKQSKKKRSKSLLGNRLENLSINSVCPYLTLSIPLNFCSLLFAKLQKDSIPFICDLPFVNLLSI